MNWYLDVLKKYAVFTGRARRSEFWYFILINFGIAVVIGIIAGMIRFPLLSTIYSLAVLVPTIGVWIRRMHDINKSGWFCLIPFYNIYLAAQPGDVGSNQYGPDPKNSELEIADHLVD